MTRARSSLAVHPMRLVVGVTAAGRNCRLSLECGHERLHSPGVPLPTYKYCPECEASGTDRNAAFLEH